MACIKQIIFVNLQQLDANMQTPAHDNYFDPQPTNPRSPRDYSSSDQIGDGKIDRVIVPQSLTESNQTLPQEFETLTESDRQHYKENFFKAYASQLRVQTRIGDLCQLKAQLKLPKIVKPTQFEAPVKEPTSVKHRRQQSLQKTESHFEKEIKRSILEKLLSDEQLVHKPSEKKNYITATSPKDQYTLAIAAGEKHSPLLMNRNRVDEDRMAPLQKRASVYLKTPSGLVLQPQHPHLTIGSLHNYEPQLSFASQQALSVAENERDDIEQTDLKTSTKSGNNSGSLFNQRSQSVTDPVKNLSKFILSNSRNMSQTMDGQQINRAQSQAPMLSPPSEPDGLVKEFSSHFVFHNPQQRVLEQSGKSLPPIGVSPSMKSPFHKRDISLDNFRQYFQQAVHLQRNMSLSPDNKCARVQHLLQHPSLLKPAATDRRSMTIDLSSAKPQDAKSSISQKRDEDATSTINPRLEKRMKKLGQQLESSGTFMSVQERSMVSNRDLQEISNRRSASECPKDPFIGAQSLKAQGYLEPEKVEYNVNQTHGDAIVTHFQNKLERATDIILSVVHAQNKQIQKQIQVLDFMQKRPMFNGSLFDDYFEAKEILHKMTKKKAKASESVSQTETQTAPGDPKAQIKRLQPIQLRQLQLQSIQSGNTSLLGSLVESDTIVTGTAQSPQEREESSPMARVPFSPSVKKERRNTLGDNKEKITSVANSNNLGLDLSCDEPLRKSSKFKPAAKQQAATMPISIADEHSIPNTPMASHDLKQFGLVQKLNTTKLILMMNEDGRKGQTSPRHESIIDDDQSEDSSSVSSLTSQNQTFYKKECKKSSTENTPANKNAPFPYFSNFDQVADSNARQEQLEHISEHPEQFLPATPAQGTEDESVAENAQLQRLASTNTEGVHELCLYEQYLNSPSQLRKTGIYARLKADTFVKQANLKTAQETYDLAFQPVRTLFEFCEEKRKAYTFNVNPFPILHQLYQGRLFIKNQHYPKEAWLQLFKSAIEFSAGFKRVPLRFIYLDGCSISEEAISFLFASIPQFKMLREVIFSRMSFTSEQLIGLNKYLTKPLPITSPKHKPESGYKSEGKVSFTFYECGFENHWYKEGVDAFQHQPILSNQIGLMSHLVLSRCKLEDKNLEAILQKITQLQSLDISFNQFTSQRLLAFLNQIVTTFKQWGKKSHNTASGKSSLRSISVAGNPLDKTTVEEEKITLPALVKLTNITHLDFSLMKLQPDSLRAIIKALKYARSIQSIHLSDQSIKQTRVIVHEELGMLAYDRITMHKIPADVPDEWNDSLKLPNVHTDEITEQVNSCFCNSRTRIDHVRAEKESLLANQGQDAADRVKGYGDIRYVLSRITGRKDLSNNFSRIKMDPLTRKQCDIINTLEDALKLECKEERRTLDEVCWVESQECWCCERWGYHMQLVSRQHIEDCFGGEEQDKSRLTELQEKVLARLIEQNRQQYDAFEERCPYIIGEATNLEFVKLQKFTDFMLMIDPDGEYIKKTIGDKSLKVQEHYTKDNHWEKVIKKSSKPKEKTSATKNVSSLTKSNRKQLLSPYEPNVNVHSNEPIGTFDVVWATSMLVRPGKTSFFLVYKFDGQRTFKTEIKVDIPPRPTQTHYYLMPKTKYEMKEKQKEKQLESPEKNDNYYFNIFEHWPRDTEKRLKTLMELDLHAWRLGQSTLFSQGKDYIYQALIYELKLYSMELMTTFRELQSRTKTYPLLNSVQLTEWFRNINVISNNFPEFEFHAAYKELGATSDKAKLAASLKTIQPMRKQVSTKRMQEAFQMLYQKKQEEMEREATNISRHQWYELLVRLAIKKFRVPEQDKSKAKKVTISYTLTPAECFKKLMTENLLPFYRRLAHLFDVQRNFIKNELFENREVQKYLFLNQFELNNIYKVCLATKFDIVHGSVEAQDAKKKPIQRKNTIQKLTRGLSKRSIIVSKSPSKPIFENDEFSEEDMSSIQTAIVGQVSPLRKNISRLQQPQSSIEVTTSPLSPIAKKANLKDKDTDSNSNYGSTDSKMAQVTLIQKPQGLPRKMEVVQERGIEFGDLFKKTLRFVPADKISEMSQKTFQYCFVHSKIARAPFGNDNQAQENDRRRMSHLSFIEFVVFLCTVAHELHRDEMLVSENKAFFPYLKKIVDSVLQDFEIKPTEVPPVNDDPRYDNIPQKLLIGGEIVDYVPPTPERLRQSMHPADLYSDMSEHPEMQSWMNKTSGFNDTFRSKQSKHSNINSTGPFEINQIKSSFQAVSINMLKRLSQIELNTPVHRD